MVQFLLGITLIVCGALGVKYSERQKDSFEQSFNIAEEISYYSGDDFESSHHTETEPPYYIGAFPVGALVSIIFHAMYVCMYVCMYVRTYVRMYVCMYAQIIEQHHKITT